MFFTIHIGKLYLQLFYFFLNFAPGFNIIMKRLLRKDLGGFMKTYKKNLIIIAVIFSLLAGITAGTAQAYAKSSYWLYGVSVKAGGRADMYYNGNKITLKGKIRKSASQKKLYDTEEKKGKYTLKVASNCKVVLEEAENIQTIQFKQWAADAGYKKGDKVTFISAAVKVEGKKVTKIIFSA